MDRETLQRRSMNLQNKFCLDPTRWRSNLQRKREKRQSPLCRDTLVVVLPIAPFQGWITALWTTTELCALISSKRTLRLNFILCVSLNSNRIFPITYVHICTDTWLCFEIANACNAVLRSCWLLNHVKIIYNK